VKASGPNLHPHINLIDRVIEVRECDTRFEKDPESGKGQHDQIDQTVVCCHVHIHCHVGQQNAEGWLRIVDKVSCCLPGGW